MVPSRRRPRWAILSAGLALIVVLGSVGQAFAAVHPSRGFQRRLVRASGLSWTRVRDHSAVTVVRGSFPRVESVRQRSKLQVGAAGSVVRVRDVIIRFRDARSASNAQSRDANRIRATDTRPRTRVVFASGGHGVRAISCSATCSLTIAWQNIGVLARVSATGFLPASETRVTRLALRLSRAQDARIVGVPVELRPPLASVALPIA
jgi:hypothetical protein